MQKIIAEIRNTSGKMREFKDIPLDFMFLHNGLRLVKDSPNSGKTSKGINFFMNPSDSIEFDIICEEANKDYYNGTD